MKSGGSQGLRERPYRMQARARAAEATAQAIIAAACALFAERPYDEVSLPVIAERAGITVQTVLRRFGSKEELFAVAAQQRSGQIRAITDAGRRYHRDWVTRAYGPALAKLPPATRRRKLAQLTAVTDLATWRLLRRELGLSPDQTTAAIRELVDACLP